MAETNLFVGSEFVGHSGRKLPYKIDCDALTDDDLATLAAEIAHRVGSFSAVFGVPSGGLGLAFSLGRYVRVAGPPLIVDDVLTTGASMEEFRRSLGNPSAIGFVIFARGPLPAWIRALFVETPR